MPTGNAGKIVKGTEIDDEFNAIASAISSKADTASPTFTGTPAAPTAVAGTNTTQIATTAFVKSAVDTGDALKADKTTTITAGTGLTGGGDLSANRTLAIANSGVTAATYGSATKIPVIAVNAQGQVTSASEATLVPFAWNVTYISETRTSGGSYTLPSNCIMVQGYMYSPVITNNRHAIEIYNNTTLLGKVEIGHTVGANNGNGYWSYIPFSLAMSSNATKITFTSVTGTDGTFYITGYVTKA